MAEPILFESGFRLIDGHRLNLAFAQVQAPLAGNVVTVTSGDYACQADDRRIYVKQDVPAPTLITLWTAPDTSLVVTVKDAAGDAATNPITVAAPSIDGQPSFVMNQNWQCQDFAWNGNEWSVQ